MLYLQSMQALEIVPDEIAGQIIKAGCRYFAYGEDPDFDDNITLRLLWVQLKGDVDRSKEKFEAVCKRNSDIAAHRHVAPLVTTGDEWSPSAPSRMEDELKENGMNTEKKLNGAEADKPQKRKRFSPPAAGKTYCADEKLNAAVAAFVDFRKKTKRPMTEHAVDLLLSNLDKLSQSTEEKVEILNQSIVNGWTGVYPLKNSKPDVRQDLDDPLPY